MSAPGVSLPDDFSRRISAARERFAASGTTIVAWARERGFNPSLVQYVLAGKRPCVRGESHRIAVALGIKEELPPPGAPIADQADRIQGIRP